jgi:hypothetical protein
MRDDQSLSTHFSLYEMTRTDNAKLQDANRDVTDDQVGKLTMLAGWLEGGARPLVGPMRVHSAYRCDALNGVLPGHSSTSQHPKCEAVDFDRGLGTEPSIAGGLTAKTLYGAYGEELHTLTIAEMPAHTHSTYALNAYTPNQGGGSNYNTNYGSQDSSSTGGDGSHNNIQPCRAYTPIIRT